MSSKRAFAVAAGLEELIGRAETLGQYAGIGYGGSRARRHGPRGREVTLDGGATATAAAGMPQPSGSCCQSSFTSYVYFPLPTSVPVAIFFSS